MTEPPLIWRLFNELLDRPPSERAAMLEGLASQPKVQARLRAMLDVEERLGDAPGEEAAPRAYPWPGDTIGAYQLLAPIGDGGMGSVWLASSRAAAELMVAVKFPAPGRFEVEEARLRLIQERRILAQLDHPNVVNVVDAGETDAGVPFVVLEALRGRPIDAFVRDRRPDLATTLRMIEQLAGALDHAHARGFIHRDVKPGNVIVSDEGWPVLIDFGAARVTERASIESSSLTVGGAPRTPAYASPEQNRGEEATSSADVFSLGALARTLFEGLVDDLPEARRRALDEALARAGHAEPAERFGSAGDFAAALVEGLLGAEQRGAAPARRPGPLVAVALLAAGIAAGLVASRLLQRETDLERFGAAVLEEIEVLPTLDIPIDTETLGAIAAERGSPSLRVAYAARLADDGEVEQGAAIALEAVAEDWPLPGERRLDLARLCTRLGLPAAALSGLERVNPELLEHDARVEYRLLRATNLVRSGAPLDQADVDDLLRTAWTADEPELEAFLEDLEELEEAEFELPELDADEPAVALLLLLLGIGEPEVLGTWLDWVDGDRWEEPEVAATGELHALLRLHAVLRDTGLVDPLDPDVLAEISAELAERLEEEDEEPALRAWALARLLRARVLLAENPANAARLAESVVVGVRESCWKPVDVLAQALALQAVAASRAAGAGREGEGDALFDEARDAARRAAGPDSGLLERIERAWEDRATEAPAFTEGQLLSDVDELLEERGRPWWAP
ncbi:MAG: serine/threonine-protein kinase [Planctomycetota bacterium]